LRSAAVDIDSTKTNSGLKGEGGNATRRNHGAYATYSVVSLASRLSSFILTLRFFANPIHLQQLTQPKALMVFNTAWRKKAKGRMFHISTKGNITRQASRIAIHTQGKLSVVTQVRKGRIFAMKGDLHSKPAPSAAGSEELFIVGEGGGRCLEAPRGRRP